jgi:hypothetical protein
MERRRLPTGFSGVSLHVLSAPSNSQDITNCLLRDRTLTCLLVREFPFVVTSLTRDPKFISRKVLSVAPVGSALVKWPEREADG